MIGRPITVSKKIKRMFPDEPKQIFDIWNKMLRDSSSRNIDICDEWYSLDTTDLKDDTIINSLTYFINWSHQQNYHAPSSTDEHRDWLSLVILHPEKGYHPDNCIFVPNHDVATYTSNLVYVVHKPSTEEYKAIYMPKFMDLIERDIREFFKLKDECWIWYEMFETLIHPEYKLRLVYNGDRPSYVHTLVDGDGFVKLVNIEKVYDEVIAIYGED